MNGRRSLVLLGCALILGVSLFVFRARGRPHADRAVPDRVQAAPADAAISERPGEVLDDQPVDGERMHLGTVDPAPVPPNHSPDNKVVDFLPYPNEGESAYKLKYEGMDVEALIAAKAILKQRLNEEVERLAEERYTQGLFEERVYASSDAANADSRKASAPQGMGDVWPCERGTLQADGSIKHCITFLTQAEHPEVFAHRDELIWVAHAPKHKQK
jgi:hypothetical protein